jgi:Disulphide bond corrector protein DsbC
MKLSTKLGLLFLCGLPLLAQDAPVRKIPAVTVAPIPLTEITRGKTNSIELDFRVPSGYHINSNKPSAEYLIPTSLRLDVPTDILVGKIEYPDGQEMSFAFAPDEKLSVYTGDFSVTLHVRPLSSVLPGKYDFHGELKYQACDNAACYPPKKLPVRFEVNVLKAPKPKAKNPAQSPNIHN